MSAVLTHPEITPQRPDWLAGAPGFEPGNGGIKIRCLTTWLRPNGRLRACPIPSESGHECYRLAHVLNRRTGSHPGSSPGRAFAGTCAKSSARDDSGGARPDQRPRFPGLRADAITRAAIGV